MGQLSFRSIHLAMIKRFHLASTTSTNDIAKTLLHHNNDELLGSSGLSALAVTADEQTAGRGRSGKTWSSKHDDNLYCSIALRHRLSAHTAQSNPFLQGSSGSALRHPTTKTLVTLQAVGCLAAKAALEEVATTNFQPSDDMPAPPIFVLKYPNDIYAVKASALKRSSEHTSSVSTPANIPANSTANSTANAPAQPSLPAWMLAESRKVCGVLVEHEFSGSTWMASIIGIGINVRQRVFEGELSRKAASILEYGVDSSVEYLTQALLRYSILLLKKLEHHPDEVFEAWRAELALEGMYLRLAGTSSWWRVERLLDDGRLLTVSVPHGEERIVDNGDSLATLHAV